MPLAASQIFAVLSSARRGQPLPVRAERHAIHIARMPAEGEQFLAAGGVPNLRRLVRAAGGQPLPVRAERHAIDRTSRAR